MEQVPAKISRRTIALGGPASVAMTPLAPFAKLASIAPAGAAAALGAVNTNAAAATNTTLNAFAVWYAYTFRPIAGEAAVAAMMQVCGLSGWVAFAKVKDDREYANNLYVGLSTQQNADLLTYTKSNTDSLIAARGDRAAIVKARGDYLTYLITLCADQARLINLIHSEPRLWENVIVFLKNAHTQASQYSTVLSQVTAAQNVHSARYLRGNNETYDRLEVVTISRWPFRSVETDKVAVKLGTYRGPVKRYQLRRTNSWWDATRNQAEYKEQDLINHGLNASYIEGEWYEDHAIIESDAYKLELDQLKGISYYVDKDYEQNGLLPNHTTAQQTRHLLYNATTFIASETGLVYEGYWVAQLVLRVFTQATIAVTRFRIYDKKIDLAACATTVQNLLTQSQEYNDLSSKSQGEIKVATNILLGLLSVNVVYSATAIGVSYEIVAENPNATQAKQTELAVARFRTRATASQTAASLVALGILNVATLSKADYADEVRVYIGSGFALSDLTGAINTMISVRRSTKPIAEKLPVLLGGVAQFVTAIVSGADGAYRLFNYSKGRGSSQSVYPNALVPIQVATAAAGITAFASIVGAMISIAA